MRIVVFLVVVAWGGHASAQTSSFQPSRTLVPSVFPRWDVSGSLGMLNISTSEVGSSPWRAWDQKIEYRADLGRYWTTHLRTELAVSTSNRWDDYEVTPFPPNGVPSPSFAYTQIDRRLANVAPAVTWQFRENTFMHPYASGGMNLGLLREHRVRAPDLYRLGGQSAPAVPLDERSTRLIARPFFAGGFKSYMSRSTFVRTEGRLAVGPAGAAHLSLVAGVGFDF